MARLHLRLFGSPQIEVNDRPIELATRKVLALLAYIAVNGQGQSRDALATLLWPESDQAHARGSLRHALATLREVLGEEWLELQGETIMVRRSHDLTVDVTQFLSAIEACRTHGHRADQVCSACEQPLSAAAALYAGDFLNGFSLSDSPEFDEWQYFQSERLRNECASVLKRLVELHSSQHQWEQAAEYGQRWVALDPLHEEAQRRLMQIYAWAGRRTAALRQYHSCVRLLQEELDASPAPETTLLFEAIKAGRLSAPTPPVAQVEQSSPPSALSTVAASPRRQDTTIPAGRAPLFVAREAEMARLEASLTKALAGEGQVLFVTGEAGSGKSMMLQEFARRALAAQDDLLSAAGNCNAFTGVGDPYLPFRELLQQLTGDVQADVAGILPRSAAGRYRRSLVPMAEALLQDGPGLVGAFVPSTALMAHTSNGTQRQLRELIAQNTGGGTLLNQEQMVEQVTRTLLTLAAQHPLLLIVDDLQWADAASIALFFHLARRVEHSHILLVGAYRPTDVAVGRGAERHPLRPLMNELQRYLGDIRIDLDQAAESAGIDFINALLDKETNHLDAAFRTALYRQTEGHPLFTVQLLRGLQEHGDVVRDAEGFWVQGNKVDWETLPARVEGIIAERIGRLDDAMREVLTVASIEGESFTAEVVARVQGVDAREMVQLLSGDLDRNHHLVRAIGVSWGGGGRLSLYRFRHFLFQKYLYQNLNESERAYLHEDVGLGLEIMHSEQLADLAVSLARHFQEAGRIEKAANYLLLAVKQALALFAHAEAIVYCHQGLTLLATLPPTLERSRTELGFQLALAHAYQATQDYGAPEIERAYNRALELCRQLDDRSDNSTALITALVGLGIFYFSRLQLDLAREIAMRMSDRAEQANDSTIQSIACWLLGCVDFSQGEFINAQIHFRRAVSHLGLRSGHGTTSLYDFEPELQSLITLTQTLWILGFPTQSQKCLAEVRVALQSLAYPVSTLLMKTQVIMYYQLQNEAYAAYQLAQEIVTESNGYGWPFWSVVALHVRGWSLVKMGAHTEGLTQMRSAAESLNVGSMKISQAYMRGILATALGEAGQIDEGLVCMDEALALADAYPDRYYEAELHRLKGELLLARNLPEEVSAEGSFLQAIAVAQRQRAKMWELRATVSLCRLWQRQGKGVEAHALLAAIYAWFTEGFDTPDLIETKALLEALR